MPKRPDPADDESLKRLGGGRWQTRDERFTIEPQSGTWAVVDAEQTDDLGMPLVRGPFPSLTAAKAAIGVARSSAPAQSPLADRLAGNPAPSGEPAKPAGPKGRRSAAAQTPEPSAPARATQDPPQDRDAPGRGAPAKRPTAPRAADPEEPTWIADLSAADRGRARRLIGTLRDAGVADAEGIVRRDLVGGVPAVAAVAVARRLDGLGEGADPVAVGAILADGRDDVLGVRWRLVDGDGRPILIEAPAAKRKR